MYDVIVSTHTVERDKLPAEVLKEVEKQERIYGTFLVQAKHTEYDRLDGSYDSDKWRLTFRTVGGVSYVDMYADYDFYSDRRYHRHQWYITDDDVELANKILEMGVSADGKSLQY